MKSIWALHGFLGLPTDFQKIKELCLHKNPGLNWMSVDYLHLRELSPQNPLEKWGHHFNQFVKSSGKLGDQNFLLGYSQGGRLALQALKAEPNLWSSTILVSANPGIHAWEKTSRLQNDQEWAQSFLTEKFDKVVARWNSAKVFEGSQVEPPRSEQDYNRRQLADCLLNWSVAHQEDFRIFLENFQGSLTYVTGQRDSKYTQLGQDLEMKNKKIQHVNVSGSGHRVLFDQPERLSQLILQVVGC